MNNDFTVLSTLDQPGRYRMPTEGAIAAPVPVSGPQWSANGRIAHFGPLLGVALANERYGIGACISVQHETRQPCTDVFIDVGCAGGVAAIKLSLTAGELRELAGALLSAAVEIEARQ